jgi:peptidyl-prolyl cis-trans isomerase SurA
MEFAPLTARPGSVWEPRSVRTRLLHRPVVAGLALAAALGGLTACRTDPNVAAYVGDARITVAELESAVDTRLENEAIAAFAANDEAQFTRQVLGLLVQEEVYLQVAEQYGLDVDDDEVRRRIDELLGGQDPDTAFGQLAERGISRPDVIENVRQQLVRQQVAEQAGLADDLSIEALRSRYEAERESLGEPELGYITVTDEAAANALATQLNANPAAYPQLAAQYPGAYTLPELETRAPADVPAPLAESVAAAEPNSAFVVPVPEIGIVVGFVGEIVYPTFEEVRGSFEEEAAQAADQAAEELVGEVRDALEITINPAYGVLGDEGIQPSGDGVVDLLDQEGTDGAEPADAAGN